MKKLVALFICISFVLVPCFAYASTVSGSALTFDDQWLFSAGGIKPIEVASVEANDIKAATADTSVFLNGFSTGSQLYYLYYPRNGLMQTESYPSGYTTLSGLASGLSYSIAHNTQVLISAIPSYTQYIDGIEGLIDGLESDVSLIASRASTTNTRLNTINNSIGTSNTTLSNILTAIQNQSLTIPQSLLDDVDSIETKVPSQDYYWKKFLTNASGQIPTISQGGVFRQQAFDFGSNSLLGGIEGLLYYGLTGTTNGVSLLVRDVRDNNAALDDYLYDSSLTATLIPRTTVWQNMRDFWTNTSYHLSRLAFVLANDDDIAARQAAAANTAAAVSNVISPSGSGSAKPSDISGIADLKSSVSDSVSTGVNVNSIFTETGSGGHAWDWFSQGIQDELSAPSRRSNVRSNSKSSGSDTPMLDAYYHDLEEAIGFKLW